MLAGVAGCVCTPSSPRSPSCAILVLQIGDYGDLPATPSPTSSSPAYWVSSRLTMAAYAAVQGYGYVYVDTAGAAALAPPRAPAWLKLPCLHALLPFYDTVVLADADVYPSQLTRRLTDLAPGTAPRARKEDVMVVAADKFGACTGFMLHKGARSGGDGGRVCPPADSRVLLRDWWRAPVVEGSLSRFTTKHPWEQAPLWAYGSRWMKYYRKRVHLLPADSVGTPHARSFTHYWSNRKWNRVAKLGAGLQQVANGVGTACTTLWGGDAARCVTSAKAALAGSPSAHPTLSWEGEVEPQAHAPGGFFYALEEGGEGSECVR